VFILEIVFHVALAIYSPAPQIPLVCLPNLQHVYLLFAIAPLVVSLANVRLLPMLVLLTFEAGFTHFRPSHYFQR